MDERRIGKERSDLLRNRCGGSHRSDVETEFACFALKVAWSAFSEELFVGLLSGFDVSLAEFEHAIEQAGELVGSGVNGCGRSETRFNASDESADGSLTLHGALGGQAQGSGGAIGVFSRLARKDFASADPIIGSDIEPRAKMLFARPAAHIQTDFREDPLHGQQIEPG